jgi:hypothetical protein
LPPDTFAASFSPNKILKMMYSIKKIIFGSLVCFLGLMNPLSATYSNTGVDTLNTVTCPTPTVDLTSQGSNSLTFSIAAASGTSVRYWLVRKEGGGRSETTTNSGTLVISGLTAGTYTVYFEGVCGSEVSEYVIIDDLIII